VGTTIARRIARELALGAARGQGGDAPPAAVLNRSYLFGCLSMLVLGWEQPAPARTRT